MHQESDDVCHHVDDHLESQGVHLQQHLEGEEDDKEHICDLLELFQPVRLVVVLGGEDPGVEEDQDDDEPEHGLRLDRPPTISSGLPIPPLNLFPFPLEPVSSVRSISAIIVFHNSLLCLEILPRFFDVLN